MDYFFGYLPSTNVGTSDAAFCTTYASEMTGTDAWCLDSAGVNNTGKAFTTAGSPTAISLPLCPNGTDCDTIPEKQFTTTSDYYSTTSTATGPTGSFSECYFGAVDIGTSRILVSKDRQQAAAKEVFYMGYNGGTGALDCVVYKAGATSSTASSAGSSFITNGQHLLCCTYAYVSDGASTLTAYIDGTAGTPVTTAVGPPDSQTASHYVGRREGTTLPTHNTAGLFRWALYTEKALSAGTISNMSLSLRPRPKGANGETVAYTRAASSACPNSTGSTWAYMDKAQPCINANGLVQFPSRTNQTTYSQDYNGHWDATGTIVRGTADQYAGPDGFTTAESIQSTTDGAYVNSSQTWDPASSSASLSCWAKATSGTQAFQFGVFEGATQKALCSATATTTWQRFYCNGGTLASGHFYNTRLLPGGATQGTVIFQDCQSEPSGATAASAPIVVPSSVEVQRSAHDAALYTGVTDNRTEGCAAATVTFHPFNVPSSHAVISNGTERVISANSATVMAVMDGTASVTATVSNVLGRTINIRTWWRASSSTMGITADGVSNSGAFDGSMTTFNIAVGSKGNGSQHLTGGAIKNVKVGDRWDGCN